MDKLDALNELKRLANENIVLPQDYEAISKVVLKDDTSFEATNLAKARLFDLFNDKTITGEVYEALADTFKTVTPEVIVNSTPNNGQTFNATAGTTINAVPSTDESKPIKGKALGFLLGFFLSLVGLILGIILGDEKCKSGAILGFIFDFIVGIIIVIIVVVVTFAVLGAEGVTYLNLL